MTEPVTVTERAARRIAEIVAAETGSRALRVSVEGGGCSGFQYRFDLVPELSPDDVVLERAGARVVIDKVSLGGTGGDRRRASTA
jgi:iron-sulfur cluster assembly accessory protein